MKGNFWKLPALFRTVAHRHWMDRTRSNVGSWSSGKGLGSLGTTVRAERAALVLGGVADTSKLRG